MPESPMTAPMPLAAMLADAERELRRRLSQYADGWVTMPPPRIPLAEYQIACQQALCMLVADMQRLQATATRGIVSDRVLVEMLHVVFNHYPLIEGEAPDAQADL